MESIVSKVEGRRDVMLNNLLKIAIGGSDGNIEDQVEGLIERRIAPSRRPWVGGRGAIDCRVGESAVIPHIGVRSEVEEEDLL